MEGQAEEPADPVEVNWALTFLCLCIGLMFWLPRRAFFIGLV
jgi:hypothetical protein